MLIAVWDQKMPVDTIQPPIRMFGWGKVDRFRSAMAQDKLPSALDVARYVAWLAAHDSERPRPNGLTPKEIQKILYYVQGWSLGKRDRPIFSETVKAWRDGPVVVQVYDQYKDRAITADESEEIELPPLVKAFVASVWEEYKWFTERELIEKTHNERPWREARTGLKDFEPSDVPIPAAALREFFSQESPEDLSASELLEIAKRKENAPPASWYHEPE